jgi:hypothetical protein
MTDYRIQTIDYKFMLHKELSGSLKSEILSTKSETNPNYTNLMFKTLSGLTDNAFWRAPHQKQIVLVRDDSCGSPLYLSPTGGSC